MQYAAKPGLSERGNALLRDGPTAEYLVEHHDRSADGHHPVDNPDGYICLAVAENRLVWDLLRPRLTAPRTNLPHRAVCYDDHGGSAPFRESLAYFMGRTFLGREIDASLLTVLAGAGSVLEILFFAIADPGDGVLVPTPSYAGFWADLETRDELTIVPVHTSSSDGFRLTTDALDSALDGADRPIKALVYTNPSNPTGYVASAHEIAEVLDWADRRGIHLVLDEIYALSIHGATPFVSGASLRPALGDNVHVVWAFSKDFGASGLRCGVLVSENEAVTQAVRALAYWAVVSGDTQYVLGEMVADDAWVDGYLAGMRAGLGDTYTLVTGALDQAGIPHLPADGGFFFLCDMRRFLDEPTWEGEAALWRRILEQAGVNLTPGSACRIGEPGFMRLCFASQPVETVITAVERIGRLLKD